MAKNHHNTHLSHLTSKSWRSLELTSLKPALVHLSGSGSSNVTSSGEVEGRRSMVAFAGVEEADKTNRMENRRDKVLVSRVTLLQAAWGHGGARLSRLAVITLSSDSHQRSSFSSLTPVPPAD